MSKFIKFIFRNFVYKLIAITLSIVFWYIVQSEQILEINRKVRVQLIAPEGFVIKGGNIQYKDAMLRGPRALLNHFPMEPILAQIKLFADKPQNIRSRVDKEYIRGWNDRIKITIYDAYISVYLDKKIEKEVPVKQNLMGVPKDGFLVEKVILNPEKVFISGPASDMQRIDSISTEPVDINNLSSSKTFEANLLASDLTMKADPQKVQIIVNIGEKKINRSFFNIPIEVEGSSLSFKLITSRISVVLQGHPELLDSIKSKDIRAVLNIKDLGPGIHEEKLQIKIPQDSVLLESTPEKISIEVYSKKKNL